MRYTIVLAVLLAACGSAAPTPTAYQTPTREPTPTFAPSWTPRPPPTPTRAPAVTQTPIPSLVVPADPRVPPNSPTTCPTTHPIKGNKDSMIYHMPGQQAYNTTKPEDCFLNEAAAIKAGYRKAAR